MAEPIYYPVNDFGPAMRGMVIGAVGILHVFLAQFSIGGCFLGALLVFDALATAMIATRSELFI